jgi:hypothetical protein
MRTVAVWKFDSADGAERATKIFTNLSDEQEAVLRDAFAD